MFDVGFWEITLIGIMALIILGPERLPKAARTAGLWVGKARRMMAEVKRDIKAELDAEELSQLREMGEDIKTAGESLKGQVESTQQSFRQSTTDMDKAITDALNEDAMNGLDEASQVPVTASTGAKNNKKGLKKKTAQRKVAKKVAKKTAKKTTQKTARKTTKKTPGKSARRAEKA